MSKTKKTAAEPKTGKKAAPVDVAAPYTTTVKIDGQIYAQRYYEPMHGYDKLTTKKIIVIAFADDNKILGIRNKNRVDILRGTSTWEDNTPEDAARREAREEGNVTLGQVSLAAVITSNPKDAPEQITYMLVMAARIQSVDPYKPWHGTHKRSLLTKEKLLRVSAEKAKDLIQMIKMAEFVLSDKPEITDHMRYIMENL